MRLPRVIRDFTRNQYVRDVILFALLIGSFHYLYCYWASSGFYPFKAQVDALFVSASRLLFEQTIWILDRFPDLHFYTRDQTVYVLSRTGNVGYVAIEPGCTSLKQWLHWIFLMTIFPGPVRHKLWYIPSGLIIIHLINVTRTTGLALILAPWPEYFHYFHNYVFKGLFYFSIFCMWVIWNEFFNHKERVVSPLSSKN